MKPQNSEPIESLKQIYKSAIGRSYIRGFNNPEAIKKSKIELENVEKQQMGNIDEKTFRIMPNFNRPNETFIIYKKSGKCYLEEEGFFACFSTRRPYDIQLKNSKLSIIAGERIHRFVDFNVVWANVARKGSGFVISFEQCPNQIYIQPVSKNKQNESDEWVKMISSVINQTDGKAKKYLYFMLKNSNDFYKTQHVLNQQFEKSANTGDVLLFKSQHSAATVQRIFTDSQYDHVAVLLRNKKNQLFVFESTSDSGVAYTPWRHYIRYQWYTLTDKICWKPLLIQLKTKDVQTIEAFVAKTLGKGFQINLEKLFKFQSTLKRSQQTQENKTYFCSELVARLYKELGILDSSKSSTTYYPVDFSDKGYLKIIRPGVTIKNERILSFDKNHAI